MIGLILEDVVECIIKLVVLLPLVWDPPVNPHLLLHRLQLLLLITVILEILIGNSLIVYSAESTSPHEHASLAKSIHFLFKVLRIGELNFGLFL